MPRTPAAGQKRTESGKRSATARKIHQGDTKSAAKAKGQKSRLLMVRALIEKWSEELAKRGTKSGVAELIRLLALEKELSVTNEAVREIKVSWVEPKATESSKSE